jgi:hypothetical protein
VSAPATFARLGDRIQTELRQPFQQTVTYVLETREAVAFANELLTRKPPAWRLLARTPDPSPTKENP